MHLTRSLRGSFAAVVVALSASCASATGSAANTGGSGGGNPNLITASDIASAAAGEASVYEAIQRLRPMFLQTRGRPGSVPDAGAISASIDGGPLSDVEALRYLHASQVKEIRYLSASDAAQRFGVRANSGPVILVSQK